VRDLQPSHSPVAQVRTVAHLEHRAKPNEVIWSSTVLQTLHIPDCTPLDRYGRCARSLERAISRIDPHPHRHPHLRPRPRLLAEGTSSRNTAAVVLSAECMHAAVFVI